MRFTEIISETKPGLWANIHAKRDRIKNGSGEHMRKPGSKGAPTADALRKSATDEAANPAQQAAIAINMKKHHQKPKDVAEAGMPSSVVKSKQRYAAMSDKDFHTAHKDKSEDDLKAMAWRHGYGKGSTHYVDKHKKGQQGVAEGAPELLKAEMPLVRHIEQELAQHGYEKGTPEYDQMFKHTISMYRKFGNVDAIKRGVAEGSDELYQKAIRKYVQQVAHDYLGGGNAHLYGANKFDADMFGVSQEQAKQDFKTLFPQALKQLQGVAEGENWSKYNHKRVGGMSKKSVSSYRRSHPGSKIQTAVTTKPSKLKKGSKAAKRRASFCARMRGMKKHRTGAKTAHDPNSNINKSLRRWHCESIEELHELVMLAEQYIRNNKK
jgi:Domain of unknown function (DUF6321)